MSTVNNSPNLEAYYSINTKIQRKPIIATPPTEQLPQVRLWDDEKANIKIKALNKDIYEKAKKQEKKSWF